MLNINNRRYIGSKTKLLGEIRQSIPKKFLTKGMIFADFFAGTGVVAYSLRNVAKKIIVNDILYSNIVVYKAFFSDQKIDEEKLEKLFYKFNHLNPETIKPNYFSKIYGKKYFSDNDAKIIGYIRDYLEAHKKTVNEREYCILLTSLMYTADKIANTCGHFEFYLSSKPKDKGVYLKNLDIEDIKGCEIYNEDANKLVKKIKCDVAYIDPPYNARQYINFYHVLENLARWSKPTEFEGNSMKFKRNELKSGYSRSKATELMEDLINNIDAKVIIVSYNNTYDAKSGASNNKIQEKQLEKILKRKGKLSIKEINYKSFNAGKTDLKNHKEKIYICVISS